MGDLSKGEETHESYNPCYYLELAVKGFLKCLGLYSFSPQGEEKRNETSSEDDPTSTTEQQMKSSEDSRSRFSFSVLTIRGRPPPRPLVGTGKPPQNNSSSS
ncbi:hypothetical protein IFM89_018970 [Coptis chinensis]|uniref:Uncharacterized protein n=1 Tax=Coptis chinensis TaxID=261450 RepID=A0A835I1D3_9MAGN|nr:hypothetical protein IFM89_018970 [Coptis chinensis]